MAEVLAHPEYSRDADMQRFPTGSLPRVDSSNLRDVNGNTLQDLCEHIDPVAFKEGRIIALLQIHKSKMLCYLSPVVVTFVKGAVRREARIALQKAIPTRGGAARPF